MRNLFALLALSGVLAGCRKSTPPPPPAELLARWHFIGTAALSSDTNATQLREIEALPESRKLREPLLRKLAGAALTLFSPPTTAAPADPAALLRPLLEDCLRVETVFESYGQKRQPVSWRLAARLAVEREKLWRTNLAQLLSAGKPGGLSDASPPGSHVWQIALPPGRGAFVFFRAGDWVVLGITSGKDSLTKDWASQILHTGRPATAAGNYWLAAEFNFPRLVPRLDWPSAIRWPHAHLTVSGKGDNLHANARLLYAEPLQVTFEPWRVPTNSVFDPLISFTAARGFSNWLGGQAVLKQLGWQPAPNQAFVWAQSQIPFQTFAAAPVAAAGQLLPRLATRLPSVLASNLQQQLVGEIRWASNRTELIWQGLPIIVPFLRPETGTDGEFLYGGLFPNAPGQPPPAELFTQLDRPGLLYYDWEITQERLMQWRQLFQLCQLVVASPVGAKNSTAQEWLVAVAPHLGNSVTEISSVSPRELSLVRKAHLGLTGFELVWLARQFDASEPPEPGPAGLPATNPPAGPPPAKP